MAPTGRSKTLEKKNYAISTRFNFGSRSDQMLFAGLVLAAATVVVYVVMVAGESEADDRTRAVLIVTTLVLAVVGAALTSERSRAPALVRAAGLGSSVAALLTWGVLGTFSFGVPIFIAGLLVLGGGQELLDEAATRRTTAAASLATVGALVLGLSLT